MIKRLLLLVVVLAMVVAACGGDSVEETTTTTAADGDDGGGQVTGEGVLAQVQSRGVLNCGVNSEVFGFGFVDADGNFVGFDIDYCKAVAAAVLGDADAVDYKALTAQQRFTALQSGEIDVLIRNTTWTASRDGKEGGTFVTTTFYDGQGMMVKSDSGISSIEDMNNTTVCTQSGTTTELNLADRFAAGGLAFTPLTFDSNDELRPAFVADQCDGWTSDKSQLASFRSTNPEADGGPEAWTILEETFSKEPLGPMVLDGDSQWAQVVNWTVFATIQAEEFGLDSSNVESYSGDNPNILKFLGKPTGDPPTVADPALGLPTDFAVKVISQVGNYEEIYNRNVGPDTALGLVRGVNDLWTRGGLLYAPPYR
jgi:general L-amino acid transport system substrate-binding protein